MEVEKNVFFYYNICGEKQGMFVTCQLCNKAIIGEFNAEFPQLH